MSAPKPAVVAQAPRALKLDARTSFGRRPEVWWDEEGMPHQRMAWAVMANFGSSDRTMYRHGLVAGTLASRSEVALMLWRMRAHAHKRAAELAKAEGC